MAERTTGNPNAGLVARVGEHRYPYGRHSLPYTDARLNDLLGGVWDRIAAGTRGISPTEVQTLAAALAVDPHWLATGRADPHRVSYIGCPPPADA